MRLVAFAAAAAALLAPVLAPSAQAGEVLDRIKEKGELVMSTDPEYPPQSFLGDNNEFVGFDIDVGAELAKRLGVDIKFVTPSWDVIVAGNWAGRWDISVGSMTPTKARAEVLDFPAIYYYTPASLAVHETNTSIKTVENASGKTLGVGVATTYENYLNGNLEIDSVDAPPFSYKISDATIRTYETDVLALDDLRLGDGVRLDGVVTALPTILEAQKTGMPVKVVGGPLFLEPLAIAIDKGDPELAEAISSAVEEMRADGTLTELSKKWYGTDLTQ